MRTRKNWTTIAITKGTKNKLKRIKGLLELSSLEKAIISLMKSRGY